jgi:hypothetical protein
MSDGKRIKADVAYPIAGKLMQMLRPHTEWIEVAGSLRRGSPDVGDVEIVAVPKGDMKPHDVMVETDNLVDLGVIKKAQIPLRKGGTTTRWGSKMRAISFEEVKFDLFCCDMDNRGLIYWLRTGPDSGKDRGSTTLMTWLKRKRAPFRVEGGYVKAGGRMLSISSESDWFDLLGLPYIPPTDRSASLYNKLFRNSDHVWGDPDKYISRAQLVLFDLQEFLSIQDTHSGLDPGTSSKTKKGSVAPPLLPWESPWLVGNMVWLHEGYGVWRLSPVTSPFAGIWQTVYALNPRKYLTDSERLRSFLSLNQDEVRIVRVAESLVSALRGIAV